MQSAWPFSFPLGIFCRVGTELRCVLKDCIGSPAVEGFVSEAGDRNRDKTRFASAEMFALLCICPELPLLCDVKIRSVMFPPNVSVGIWSNIEICA
jgi:hypothetical protein